MRRFSLPDGQPRGGGWVLGEMANVLQKTLHAPSLTIFILSPIRAMPQVPYSQAFWALRQWGDWPYWARVSARKNVPKYGM